MSPWTLAGVVLSVALGAATPFVWRRRGALFGLRWFAVALVPAGLALAGLLQLFGRIGNAIAAFVSRFVFSPTVWVGYAVLGVAVVLWLVARFVAARGLGGDSGGPSRVEGAKPQVEPRRRAAAPAAGGDEFDDIEELLRKRGIS